MSVQIYWLVFAPGVMFGLSLVGWLALWLTRPRPAAAPVATFNRVGPTGKKAPRRSP